MAGAIVLLSAGFMAHVVPGFHNVKVLSDVTLSPDAMPYSQSLNFDKGTMGLLLLACGSGLLQSRDAWAYVLKFTLRWGLGLAAVLISLAMLMQYVRLEAKFPSVFFLWAWINLFFTCLPEEAFFRGLLQRNLQAALAPARYAPPVALAVSAVLFGLGHLGGGLEFMVLATVAGCGYGWVYQRTGAIEASIGVHFLVNALHFVFFTYPALH